MKILEGNIDWVDTLAPKDFNKMYYSVSKPVILLKYTTNWKNLKIWNLDYFKKYSDEDKYIAVLKGGLSHPPNREILMNFGKFLDKVEPQIAATLETEHHYLQQSPIRDFEGLIKDFEWPDLFLHCPDTILGDNTIFIGSGHIRTTIHYDRPLVSNLFCQIVGRKRIRLWKPSMGHYLYPFSFQTNYSHVSQIPELDLVDKDKFPLFSKSQIFVDLILEAGEVIFIPKGWWHHISHCQELSISMNFWYT
jgi:hypothetical protein